jgi:Tfp pilus assembly protein PilF
MKYAKAARAALLRAERMDPEALGGGLYASLGALYSKVPGGFIGFGDDELAAEYFAKALQVDPNNIDSNFFYGEFLVDQGDYAQAIAVLDRALKAPTVETRPAFDAGRRAEIRELLATAQREAS